MKERLRIENGRLGIEEVMEEDSIFEVLRFRFKVLFLPILSIFKKIPTQPGH